jgi:hypothetical protein
MNEKSVSIWVFFTTRLEIAIQVYFPSAKRCKFKPTSQQSEKHKKKSTLLKGGHQWTVSSELELNFFQIDHDDLHIIDWFGLVSGI